MSGRCGSSSLGIVTAAFMIEDIRSHTSPVALRHRVVGDSVCRWLLYTPTFKPYPHRPWLYTWDRRKRERCCWLSATFPKQRRRIVLDRTEDSKNVLSFLHSGRLTLPEFNRDIWWHVVWQRCQHRNFTLRWIHVSSIYIRKQTQTNDFIVSSISIGVEYKRPTLLPSTDSDTYSSHPKPSDTGSY